MAQRINTKVKSNYQSKAENTFKSETKHWKHSEVVFFPKQILDWVSVFHLWLFVIVGTQERIQT